MTPGTSPVAANGALLAYAGGRVVYWPSIENDAALVLDLDLGEESDHVLELVEAEPACHILATKAGRLFAINLTNESTGAPALTFRRLQRVQTGWSAGKVGCGGWEEGSLIVSNNPNPRFDADYACHVTLLQTDPSLGLACA